MRLTLLGDPRTKKNSQRLVDAGGRTVPLASRAYTEYRDICLWQIPPPVRAMGITESVNLKCVYYMGTRRKVDLCNLIEATCDILVDAGVLADDNSRVVAGHDGSRVLYDKKNPRVEIEITIIEDHDK